MKPRVVLACVASLVSAAALWAQTGDAPQEIRIDLDHLPATQPAPAKPAATPAMKAKPAASAAMPKPAASAAMPKQSTAAVVQPASASVATAASDDAAEATPKIDGMPVSRGERGYLGVKIEDNTWKISFYDQDKKPKDVDVAAIVLRWPVQYQRNEERTELLPSADGKAMVSAKTVRPPFSFKLYITLLKDTAPGADISPEMYVIDFQQ